MKIFIKDFLQFSSDLVTFTEEILNDTHMEELTCFTEFSTKIHWMAASDVFHMFTQSIKFFWFYYRTDVWKMWFIK